MAIINPTAVDIPPRGRTRRRLLRMLIAAAVVGAVCSAAGPASAEQQCKPVNSDGRNAFVCLAVNRLADGNYAVLVGIDVAMSVAEAREYIDDPGVPFFVEIRGDDGDEDDPDLAEDLVILPITGLGASVQSGLSADFEWNVPGILLNEDSGQDEIRAEIKLIDTDTNTNITFVSKRIVGNWP